MKPATLPLALLTLVACTRPVPLREAKPPAHAAVASAPTMRDAGTSGNWQLSLQMSNGRSACAESLAADDAGGLYAIAPFYGRLVAGAHALESETTRDALVHVNRAGEVDSMGLLPAKLELVSGLRVFAGELSFVAESPRQMLGWWRVDAKGELRSHTELDVQGPLAARIASPDEVFAVSTRLSAFRSGDRVWSYPVGSSVDPVAPALSRDGRVAFVAAPSDTEAAPYQLRVLIHRQSDGQPLRALSLPEGSVVRALRFDAAGRLWVVGHARGRRAPGSLPPETPFAPTAERDGARALVLAFDESAKLSAWVEADSPGGSDALAPVESDQGALFFLFHGFYAKPSTASTLYSSFAPSSSAAPGTSLLALTLDPPALRVWPLPQNTVDLVIDSTRNLFLQSRVKAPDAAPGATDCQLTRIADPFHP